MANRFGAAGTFALAVLGAAVLVGAAAAAERPKWITDPANGCGTSNPFPSREESIKWYGDCKDGRLHGRGTLIWLRNEVETERNEGTFKDGELHGEVITTYPDGHVIVGQYRDGRRQGRFITIKPNGIYVESTFDGGELRQQRKLNAEQIAAWQRQRESKLTAALPEDSPRLAEAARQSVAATASPPSALSRALALPWTTTPAVVVPDPAVTVRRDRPSPTELARHYAGWRDTTTAYPSQYQYQYRYRYQAPVATFGTGAATVAQLGGAAQPRQPVAPRPAMPNAPVTPNAPAKSDAAGTSGGAADRLFAQGYQAERSGQFFQAENMYEKILLEHPSARTAMLANARLDALRARNGANGDSYTVAVASPANRGQRVVAVNAPNPVRRPGAAQGGRANLFTESADVGRGVCTVEGLYEGGARWCGVVLRDEDNHYRVEVRRIELPEFGTIGIGRSPCTGNTFLNWFSRGTPLRVPKQCVGFQS